jgi:hypothetical protein
MVSAIKAYSYMISTGARDRYPPGTENTLTILGHKLRSIEVVREL